VTFRVRCRSVGLADGGNMKDITPAKRALAVLDDAPLPAAADRPKRISKKITAAIDLMVSGECKKITEAAEKVGLAV
jgi:hypothetical protein